jgi:UDP-glucuronate decarboxylase
VRALVTGGAGFVGSHLVARLLREGWRVIVLDDLSTGDRRNLPDDPRLEVRPHDVLEPFHAEVDRIWHLACPASPRWYQADPVRTTLVNVLGTRNALELGLRTGARVLLASTSEVYGDPEEHPQREEYRGAVRTTGPRACYDEGKRVAETLCADYHRSKGADVRIARIFNTYGPRMGLDDGRVVVQFARQALRGEPLTVYGDGSQTRSLCYVDDLVDGLVGLMERAQTPEPVNLGNPEEHPVLEIARRVMAIAGGAGEIRWCALPEDDPTRRRPDISRAEGLFGFRPRVGLEEGLRATVEDVRSRL